MDKEQEFTISQSLMKGLEEYRLGNECGLVFVEKYIRKNYSLFEPSEVMRLGNYFEFCCIGATTKNKEDPKPEYLKDGKTLTAPYKRLESQVENFKRFISFYNIEILNVQERWVAEGLDGTIDFIGRAKSDIHDADGVVVISANEEFIVDIKSSGLLSGNRFNDYSWDLDTLSEKRKLILQPIHYKYLSKLKFQKEYKFLFILFNTANEYEFKSILFNVSEVDFIQHKKDIANTVKWLKYYLKKGFEPRPTVVRCYDCPLKVGCQYFAAVPPITVFNLQQLFNLNE